MKNDGLIVMCLEYPSNIQEAKENKLHIQIEYINF